MKWFKKNHPDKGGTMPKDEFNTILDCYKANSFCESNNKTNKTNKTNQASPIKSNSSKVTKKNRAKIFRCMRKVANFSKIANHHKFDKSVFDPLQYNKDINDASPKMIQLLNTLNSKILIYTKKIFSRKTIFCIRISKRSLIVNLMKLCCLIS
jgi:hypothetical protein